MSQVSTRVVSAKNGSMVPVTGSGIRHMSDSLIAFQPAIDEPSNIRPSANTSSSIMLTSKVTCCHLPRGSVKRRSTYFTSLSLIDFRTSLAVFMNTPLAYRSLAYRSSQSGRGPATAGSATAGDAQYNCGMLNTISESGQFQFRSHPARIPRSGYEWLPRYWTRKSCRRRSARSGPRAPDGVDRPLHEVIPDHDL